MNMKQNLMAFGMSIVLCIYSIYIKFFGKNVSQKNLKNTAKKANASKGVNNNDTTFNTFGLKLFKFVDSLNNVKLLEKLLSVNPTIINEKDKNGNTPLMLSIIHNKNEEVISKILSYTSDFNTRNNNGDNCLMLAIANGNERLVDLILQYNVNVNVQNNQGESPLFLAIEKEQGNIVESLLNKNINLNIRNKEGKIPIEVALASEDMDLIKLLIEYGATTLVKDMNDEYIIFQLIEHPELFKNIMEIESRSPNKKKMLLTLRNNEGNTLFMEFCRRGYLKLSKFMIKHKVDLNCVNHGENALTIAVRENQLDIVKLLLTCRSVDVHHLTSDNKTPLRIAIENQNIPIIEALINHGGALILKNENENLLKNAINTGNIEILNLLLDININVDVKFGHEKNTPLIYIIKKYLKDSEVDTTEDDEYNTTNLYSSNDSDLLKNDDDHMSTTSSNSSVTTLALNKTNSIADNNYYSRVFSNIENEDDVSLYDSDDTLSDHEEDFEEEEVSNQSFSYTKDELIQDSVPSCSRNRSYSSSVVESGKTRKNLINTDIPLLNHHISFDKFYKVKDQSIDVDSGYCDMIRALLHQNAKVNLVNGSRDTALILACRYGLKNVVELLLRESNENQLDIGINLVDRYGNTALHNACKKNYTSIVRLLLTNNDTINVNIPNQNGNTPLMLAVYENNIEIIHELLKCKDINVNSLNVQLETPLIAACRMNNYKIAKILVENEAIINKRYDLNGETAIFHAIRNNNRKLTSLLLEHEASIAFKNKNGKSPLSIAKEYKYKSIITLLYIHIKNQNTLKNKASTFSLNENLIRGEEKKNLYFKAHSRNASVNLASSSSSISSNNNSLINELKNNNKPSLKVNHNRNNSVTFSIAGPHVNNNHIRHNSFNSNHTRRRSVNSDIVNVKVNKIEKMAKLENNEDEISTNIKYKTKPSIDMTKNMNGDLKHSRSRSGSPDYPMKKNSKYNLKKVHNDVKMKTYDEPKSSDESDTETTTNLLLMKAKEKVQSVSNSNPSSPKPVNKHIKSQSSIKGEPKPDEYLKPLKTACYNQNTEDIKKYYEELIQERGNVYNLPEELFEQLKNCKNENDRTIVAEKIKHYNTTRDTTSTASSMDMFAFTLLYFSDNAEAIDTMLQYGLNPNMQNNAYYTLLVLACKKNRPKSALVLLDYNADPNYQNKYDETALILACKKEMTEVIDKLIKCKANVNLRNDKGETALIMACWKKNLDIVKRLLETNVDINMKNNLEESPLFLSCLQNSYEVAEYLLKHGADVNAANNNNETPLMIARKNENKKMIDLLLKYGAKEESK
jgi:ankyrin repeat protein